ncbi:MAG: efflux RND transporter permease subunit [Alphaproteobacteria bacterium]|jgi:multidrug efflux pump|nr:efflux RND transporter permease subunit [Alphaproteobacteria bacterium]MCB1550667.1 efflux RND transporter permease subunit [Alphaproteobacteria bacterium]MCB9985741.1 efflux RND transporter permease subunit [Micavibrio sp.]
MILSDISIKRPIFAAVINLLVIIIGIVSFTRLELREYPDIDAPIVSVETAYTGASAEIIETRVTKILEDSIAGISGVKSIDSKSSDGFSSISVEFKLEKDIEEAANDVRDRVQRVQSQLPDEVEAPQISKVDANTRALFWIAFRSEVRDGPALTDYASRYVKDRLSVVDGVSRVQIGGERRYAMRVWLDRQALAARHLTVTDIQKALLQENLELPAGRIESLDREFSVRVDRVYNTVKDFGNLVVTRGNDGYLVRLKDVAALERGAENERTELHYNGISSIGLGIVKQSNANTLDVIRGVKEEMEKIKATLPRDIIMETAFDSGIFIEGAVHEVYFTILITLALVIFVIWLFLGDIRATIIPAVAIPVSLIGSFSVLLLMGFSINLLTLLALVLAIGLVVDDAIVVLENVYKRIEKGAPALASAQIGTSQVAFAVIATTLVLVAVFLPVSLMPGNSGRLFTEFAWAIIGAILFSSFVALSLSPMLCSKILKKPKLDEHGQHKTNFVTAWMNRSLERLNVKYMKALDFLFGKPLIIIGFMFVMIGFGIFFVKFISSEYAPKEDRGYFLSFIKAPEGSSLEYTKRQVKSVEQSLKNLLPPSALNNQKGTNEAHGVVTIIPGSFSSTGAVNSAFSFILLKEWGERERSVSQIVWGDFMKGTPGLFQEFMSIPGVMAFPIEPGSLGQGGFSTPVQFVILGTDYSELATWRDLVMAEAKKNEKLRNIDWDYKETKPQLRVVIDRDRAADLGVSVHDIGSTLQIFMGSLQVTNYIEDGEQYDVILQGEDQDRVKPMDMNNIYVRSSRTDDLIPLSNLISFKETANSGELNRYNRMRAITISANLAPGYTLGEALSFLETTAKQVLPADARFDYKGESREFKESGFAIYVVFCFALIAVYLFLAAQFENWIHPLVIMMAVPLAIVGALWGLFLSGATLNIYTQIGLIMLVGLAAKNGILIVEFANQLRDEGYEFYDALKTASSTRLRPILMTSVSGAAGSLPLIFASGAGAESRFPIGIVIVSGVIFSTLFTLLVIPAFYSMMAKNTKSPEYNGRKLEAELKALEQSE